MLLVKIAPMETCPFPGHLPEGGEQLVGTIYYIAFAIGPAVSSKLTTTPNQCWIATPFMVDLR